MSRSPRSAGVFAASPQCAKWQVAAVFSAVSRESSLVTRASGLSLAIRTLQPRSRFGANTSYAVDGARVQFTMPLPESPLTE